MYNIYNLIWGIKITQEIEDAFNQMEASIPEDDEDFPGSLCVRDGGWFDTVYSGSTPHTVGWIGKCVLQYPEFDRPDDQEIERKKQMISSQEKAKIIKEIDALPGWLKILIPRLGWHTVVGTS